MIPANFYSLLIGRFMLGVIVSLMTSNSGSYIKQTFSARLRRNFGAIYALSRSIGSEICYLLGYFVRSEDLTQFIILYGVSCLAVLIAILTLIFLPNTPVEMLSLNKF
jgi:sugar phosphate permease